jgi:miniconductance mechanosensitive channel
MKLDLSNLYNSVPVDFIAPFLISIFLLFVIRKLLNGYLKEFFKKTSTKIDDLLIKNKIFLNLSYIVPLLVMYNFIDIFSPYEETLERVLKCGIIIIITITINSIIAIFGELYQQSKYSGRINIKSYLQIIKLLIIILSALCITAILLNQSPFYILSGIGALTAVLILVFKDTILSLVASIQINSNNLFKIGDWIEAPSFGADGDVVDIALHNIKIQNWDKTISIIPTYKLIDSSFKNWKGMNLSGGRRIKRSIIIDQSSIRFLNEEDIEKFKKIEILNSYIENKLMNIEETNKLVNKDFQFSFNTRRITNIGTFRAYIECYLKNNKQIHNSLTFLVRQLAPSENGIPIEIYVFTNVTNWIEYEKIQADIFDHLLAILNEFDLRVFQNPTGNDFGQYVK